MSREIVYLTEEEMLAGLVEVCSNNTGAALSILDKAIMLTKQGIHAKLPESKTPMLDKTIEETIWQETLKKIKANFKHELKLGRRRGQYRLRVNMIKALCRFADEPDIAFHHLVALTDIRAIQAIEILIAFGIDVNEIANGCALPRFVSKTPHRAMLDAYAHSKIHTDLYYRNVTTVLLAVTDIPGATRDMVIKALQGIAEDLQAGIFPL